MHVHMVLTFQGCKVVRQVFTTLAEALDATQVK